MQSGQYSVLCEEKICTIQIQNYKYLHRNIAINTLMKGKLRGEQTYNWRDLDSSSEQEPNDALESRTRETRC